MAQVNLERRIEKTLRSKFKPFANDPTWWVDHLVGLKWILLPKVLQSPHWTVLTEPFTQYIMAQSIKFCVQILYPSWEWQWNDPP